MRLFRRGAGEVVFGKEKIHAGDYTRWGWARFASARVSWITVSLGGGGK